MPKMKTKKPTWKDVRPSIKDYDRPQLIKLVGDLYNLSKENKDFLHARFSLGHDPIKPYKKIIEESLYPDVMENEDINYDRAERAISEYSKAVGDSEGIADLMIYYVECGNKFTLDYGDIDGPFYDAMLQMYDRAIKKVLEIPKKKQVIYRERLKEIMLTSNGIGWGYHDDLCYYYYEAFKQSH